jgi:hypothetical protein
MVIWFLIEKSMIYKAKIYKNLEAIDSESNKSYIEIQISSKTDILCHDIYNFSENFHLCSY